VCAISNHHGARVPLIPSVVRSIQVNGEME
jgi:hypothetical protein